MVKLHNIPIYSDFLEKTEMKKICFSRGFKKKHKCSSFFKKYFTSMKITDKKDETLYKNFYFKSLSKF